MPTFLFDKIIFGPVKSRRLGNSLGINLLPTNSKYCNFNCVYCECGLTNTNYSDKYTDLPTRDVIKNKLAKTLQDAKHNNQPIDAITFAGNGEPTIHPDFPAIIDDTLNLRNTYFREAKIAVLSNATMAGDNLVKHALQKVDANILKLDSAFDETIKILNCPLGNFSVSDLVKTLATFNNLTIQTLFVRGKYNGVSFDNTTEQEVSAWLKLIQKIHPVQVMIYTIARDTPVNTIEKIPASQLNKIAELVRDLGYSVSVSS